MESSHLRLVLFSLALWLPNNVTGLQEDRWSFRLMDDLLPTTQAPASTRIKTETEVSTNECTSQYSCNGCHHIRVCSTGPDGKFQQLSAVVNCTDNTPYFNEDSGSCTAIMPEKCSPLSTNFMCMRVGGSYPDPLNCTRYHICKNYTAYTMECYGGTLYNSRTDQCERTDCYKFICAAKNGLKVPYGANKNVYAYCVSGKVWFIDRCPANYELNEITQNCEPFCRLEGILPDVSGASKYYVCQKDCRNVLTPFWHTCPKGFVFDPHYVQCVSS